MSNQKKEKSLEIHFDERKGNYCLRIGTADRYLMLPGRDIKLHMRKARWESLDREDDYGLKEGDNILLNAQIDRCCQYCGPLAGHPIGPIEVAGRRILVTSSAAPVQAKKGDWQRLEKFLNELLPNDNMKVSQMMRFLYWLKLARESLLEGDFRPGQMIVLAGPSGCGKSLLQTLITAFLGGRMAKPYRYMVGQTNFNADLAGAEHLVIADETARPDIRSRRELGAKVKDMCVNMEMSLHAKGIDALTVNTYRRVSLSCNDEPENLMILPPLDGSILDKLMLFKCSVASVGRDRKKAWSELFGCLPAMAWELERVKIPKALTDGKDGERYGVCSYHNPEILETVTGLSPEARLLSLIDEILWPDGREDAAPWEGGSIELEKKLRSSSFNFAVEALLHYPTACGVFLGRLATKFPERFEEKFSRGKRMWTIRKGAE